MQENLQVGELIADRYKIYQILGGKDKSGMGVVYVCFDEELGVVCALKALQDDHLDSSRMKNRFRQEALAWVRLKDHPNIVHAYAVYEYETRLFIVFEYIEPDDLNRNTLTQFLCDPIDVKQALVWGQQVCFGMEYAKSKGVTPHKDIKPDNLMINRDGVLKITDFGLANQRAFKDEAIGDLKATLSSKPNETFISGTPPWMAPEQFEGHSDERSDIYSFGVVLYQMRSNGALPIYTSKPEEFYLAHKNSKVMALNSRLFPIIKKCLEKDPKARYQNFTELRTDIENQYRSITKNDPPPLINQITFKDKEHFNKGLSLRNLGLFDEAIKEYKEAININPAFVDAYVNLGFAYQKIRQWDVAIEQYERALKLDPNNYKAIVNLGSAFLEKGMMKDAIRYLEKGLNIEPNDYIARRNLAKAFYKVGLKDRTFQESRKALILKPNDRELREILADMFYSEDRMNDAIVEYMELLKTNGHDFNLHLKLGLALSSLKYFDDAQRELQLAVDLNPKSGQGWSLLGIAYRDKGMISEAIKAWESGIKNQPDYCHNYNDLGAALINLGRYEEAAVVLKGGIKQDPKDPYLRFNLARLYSNLKQIDDAIREYRHVISLNSDIDQVHYDLGCTLYDIGQKEEALEEFVKYISIKKPDDPGVYLTLGGLFLENNYLPEALVAFTRHQELASSEDREKFRELVLKIEQSIAHKKP